MTNNEPKAGLNTNQLYLGAALIVLGVLFLFGQIFRIDIGHVLWPFFIIVPGAFMLVMALSARNVAGEGLSITGSIVTTVGLILLFQSITGYWATWAYAWALVAPTSVGVGQLLYGAVKNQPTLVRSGTRIATIGGIIFLVGACFFELVIGISGFGLGTLGWAVLLIGLGLLVMFMNVIPHGRRD